MGAKRQVIDVTAIIDVTETICEPQVFWLNTDEATEAASANHFVRGSETRSFRGVEVIEATSVVKAASAMQSALIDVTAIMHTHDLPADVIRTVLNALELAKINNVLTYRPRAVK